jgi:hypothetical protein
LYNLFHTTSSELIINLLFEEEHRLFSKLAQQAKESLAAQKTIKASVTIGKVLGTTENTLASGVNFLNTGQ